LNKLQRKAKTMLPILYRDYSKLDEDSPIAIKLSIEIDFYEHIKEDRCVCIYTDNEQCTLCRYKEVCDVRTGE
jgi:hypothetical protein